MKPIVVIALIAGMAAFAFPLVSFAPMPDVREVEPAVEAEPPEEPSYAELKEELARAREADGMRERVSREPEAVEAELVASMERIFSHWYGTKWGLGAPQTSTPQEGQINCGTFVGRTLVDAGFVIKHKKLQRQPAELIIKSLAPKSAIKRWRNKPMERFVREVREMGPGLYVIGLDFHVGYVLVRPDGDVRFIHASYVTHTVIDEPAIDASPIQSSKYRVVGKIFDERLLAKWAKGERVAVLGSW